MNKNDFIIRPEQKKDHRETETLVREAFWNLYRPGCLEHYLLHQMRSHPDFVPELNFVMEQNGRLIGQNVFVRTFIQADNGQKIPIMTMGPICIAPHLQRKGYGKQLLDYSLRQAAAMGCGALCFEGNIDFYGKSGFAYGADFGLRYRDLPLGADASFFLCKELIPGYLAGITGEYGPPPVYLVDEKEAEAFDLRFSPKEKKKLPGQILG